MWADAGRVLRSHTAALGYGGGESCLAVLTDSASPAEVSWMWKERKSLHNFLPASLGPLCEVDAPRVRQGGKRC